MFSIHFHFELQLLDTRLHTALTHNTRPSRVLCRLDCGYPFDSPQRNQCPPLYLNQPASITINCWIHSIVEIGIRCNALALDTETILN